MAEFRMPSLGADMEAGTLRQWLRQPGDRVARGDIVAEVETEKGIVEVEVFTEGVIERLLVRPGVRVPVGTPLAVIREPGEAARVVPPEAPPVPPAAAPPAPGGRARVSPAARARARDLGVDLAAVTGTGPDGAVTVADVERARPAVPAAHAPPAQAPAPVPSLAMRHAIATAMSRSKREIPHYYVGSQFDLEPVMRRVAGENAKRAPADRLLPAVLLLKAVALALRDAPELNAYWGPSGTEQKASVHLGVAIALRGEGLIAPAIHDADRLSIPDLMVAFRDLVARARAGALRSSELSDGTITVTSLGERGADAVLPIIYPPQVAIVGFGRIVQRPWVVDGAVVPRSVVTCTLAADHRVSDGMRGSVFLASLESLLARPEEL